MNIKEAYDQYGGLIKAIAGVVTVICTAAIFVAKLVLADFVDTRIDAKVATTATVAGLTTSVALNTDAIGDLSSDVGDLVIVSRDLNSDVKETLRILAEGNN